MNRGLASSAAFFAVVLDGFAALTYAGQRPFGGGLLPPVALALAVHLAAVLLCVVAAVRFRQRSDQQSTGTITVAVFAGTLACTAPVAGPAAVAVLLMAFTDGSSTAKRSNNVVIGNPLRKPHPAPRDTAEPILASLRNRNLPALRRAGPCLHRELHRHSVKALRALQLHKDPRVQLHAQGALSALTANTEQQIERLRSLATETAPAVHHRHLASLLIHLADSTLRDAIHSTTLIHEATRHLRTALGQSAKDLECRHLLAQCQLRLGALGDLAESIQQMRDLPAGQALADTLEPELLAAQGQWLLAANSAKTTSARAFWQAPRPVRA